MISCLRPLCAGSSFWLALGSPRGSEPRTSVLRFGGGNARPPNRLLYRSLHPRPTRPPASVPAPLADSCRAQRWHLAERDHRQGVHSALSIYDADANANLSILRAARKSWSWGGGWRWKWRRRGARRWSTGIEVENEVEMEMYTAFRYAVGDGDEEA
jgi:hypothetical protein